jgi:hypothetical protein
MVVRRASFTEKPFYAFGDWRNIAISLFVR